MALKGMILGPPIDVWNWIKAHNPGSPFRKRHLSFITIHYLYLMGLAILGSILLYPAHGIPYIDALFFASGAATQSGLNTIDVNNFTTYQQVVIYFIGMIANPIFINTFVVFVRLYWFEKRFQHVVREARNPGRTRSRSRTNTQAIDEKDVGLSNRGVNGRSIVVLHSDSKSTGTSRPSPFLGRPKDDQQVIPSSDSSDVLKQSSESSDEGTVPSGVPITPQPPIPFHRNITFADEVERNTTATDDRLPQQMSAEQHIAFLENQRNPKDRATLRIPGPRDFDRGDMPQTLDEENQPDLERTRSIDKTGLSKQDTDPEDDEGNNGTGHDVKRNITIEETNPDHPRLNKTTSPLSRLTLRRRGTSQSQLNLPFHHTATPMKKARSNATSFADNMNHTSTRDKEPMPYLSWQPTIGRNSAFIDLTEEQREELGGIEYRSLKTLAILLVSYFVCFHLLGVITFVPWIVRTDTWGSVVDAVSLNRVWWAIFTSATMFNDLGFTLTPDSMISFQQAVLPLLLGSFLIIIGNTGFPCMLRFIIWAFERLVPRSSGVWEEFKFLLDHPRRCFTLLFPSSATWWLFWILVVLNGLDLLFFIILDLNDPAVTSIPVGYRLLDGWFQATSTRTAGTSVVNLSLLHPGIQVSYLIMMYISVFPIAISVRRTNVYEEKSLGIYGSKMEENEDEKQPSYVGAHLRRQLSFDLWFIFLGLFIIAIAEGGRLQDPNDVAFSLFACLFEIVSAYGTVGLSLGYPTINASFSAEFSVVSKLVIIAMQIRGRHRGLPYELDRAILLPSESLHKKEDQDATKRVQRRNSTASRFSAGAPASALFSSGHDEEVVTEPVVHTTSHHTRSGLGKMMAGIAERTGHTEKKGEE